MIFDGVLLDWSGTLAFDPPLETRIRWALTRLGRPSDDGELDELVRRLRQAARLPEVVAAVHDYDRDASLHRAGKALLFQRAGLDDDLASAEYSFDTQPTNRPLFPDVAAVLRRVRGAGVRIVLISDIHFDLRTLLARQGIADLIDEFVLSFENGLVKPDPAIFALALQRLGTPPEQTVMVGDSPIHDGGAAGVGITTLILPRPSMSENMPRLTPMLALLGLASNPEPAQRSRTRT